MICERGRVHEGWMFVFGIREGEVYLDWPRVSRGVVVWVWEGGMERAGGVSNIAVLPDTVYSAVYNHLAHGNAFGIFPEGGSHDRPDLLPLKVCVRA